MKEERKYASGLYFNKPHTKAPKFVLGRLSINPTKLRAWLDENPTAEGEYINLDILEQKKDTTKGSFVVNTWKKESSGEINTDEQQEKYEKKKAKEEADRVEMMSFYGDPINPEDIPF